MAKAANSFPGMTEALKDQVGAVYQCSVEVKEYRSSVAEQRFRLLFEIEDQTLNYIGLLPDKTNMLAIQI